MNLFELTLNFISFWKREKNVIKSVKLYQNSSLELMRNLEAFNSNKDIKFKDFDRCKKLLGNFDFANPPLINKNS